MLLLSIVSVCQCFAVLEDGALAHNLQEQESKYKVKQLFDSCILCKRLLTSIMWAALHSVSVNHHCMLGSSFPEVFTTAVLCCRLAKDFRVALVCQIMQSKTTAPSSILITQPKFYEHFSISVNSRTDVYVLHNIYICISMKAFLVAAVVSLYIFVKKKKKPYNLVCIFKIPRKCHHWRAGMQQTMFQIIKTFIMI